MVGELDGLRSEGSTRLMVELLVVLAVLFAVASLVFVPALKSVAPDLFAGSVDYGKYSSLPDTPLDWAHISFNLVTFLPFLYWRLNHTELGRRFTESYREQRR